jgi:arylsulfatase A-like enzyme
VDIAPTAVAALGIPPPAEPRGFTGVDLLSPAKGDPAPPDTAYAEATLYGPERKSLRMNRWKIVVTLADSSSAPRAGDESALVRVFDLASDPRELEDLSASRPALADSLLGRLVDWSQRVGAPRTATASSLPEGIDPSVREQLEALGYAH